MAQPLSFEPERLLLPHRSDPPDRSSATRHPYRTRDASDAHREPSDARRGGVPGGAFGDVLGDVFGDGERRPEYAERTRTGVRPKIRPKSGGR